METLVKGIKEEGKATRECVAALREYAARPQSPRFVDSQARSQNTGSNNYPSQSRNYPFNREDRLALTIGRKGNDHLVQGVVGTITKARFANLVASQISVVVNG